MKKFLAVYFVAMSFAQAVSADGSVYGMGGSGRTSDGQSIGAKGGIFGFRKDLSQNTDIDVLYYNEGTAEGNHRDGMAIMGWYNTPITKQLSVQAGAGPYYSMNTTTINGQGVNEKNLGALVGMAALYHIYGTKFYLSARYTHAAVPGRVSTNTLFVGGGYAFDDTVPENWADENFDIDVMGGNSQTTRENSKMAHGFQIEVRRLQSDHVAYAVSIIREGDSQVTNRTGIAGQVWYVMPTADDRWTFAVGAGPYITKDQRDSGRTALSTLASMEAAFRISETSEISLRFNRAITRNDKDQDQFFVGFRRKIKTH
jgi:hypothetical protein